MRDFIDSVGATKLTFASMKTTLSANSFKSPHKSTSSPYQTWMGWKLILRRIWRSQGLVNRSAQVARHGSRMTLRTARRRCRRLFVGCLETCSGVSGCYEPACDGIPFHRKCRFFNRKSHWDVITKTQQYFESIPEEEQVSRSSQADYCVTDLRLPDHSATATQGGVMTISIAAFRCDRPRKARIPTVTMLRIASI
jgi:hypothetical protein